MKGVKCPDACRCPYYERETSYGKEIIRCANTDCPLYTLREEEEESEDKA